MGREGQLKEEICCDRGRQLEFLGVLKLEKVIVKICTTIDMEWTYMMVAHDHHETDL